jgi:hypothetical protein
VIVTTRPDHFTAPLGEMLRFWADKGESHGYRLRDHESGRPGFTILRYGKGRWDDKGYRWSWDDGGDHHLIEIEVPEAWVS